jgi:hypothetical protein
MMIDFGGSFNLKQYMFDEPAGWGIKTQGIIDSKTGR